MDRKVLGSNYQEKLDELGIVPGEDMDEKTTKALERTIGLLEEAKEGKFSKIKRFYYLVKIYTSFSHVDSRLTLNLRRRGSLTRAVSLNPHTESTVSTLHQLVAFWAPFLLLHLGGQDTVTAYALEDNRLWLRHLLTLVVQFLGVSYILYRYLSGSQALITAGILMFIVGAAKYAERIWALKCANSDGIDCLTDKYDELEAFANDDASSLEVGRNPMGAGMDEVEEVKHEAHVLLSVSVSQFHDCTLKKTPSYQYKTLEYLVRSNKMYSVIEMELSLMYDMMYTKAAVIHTWYGQCFRFLSLWAIVTTLLLFKLTGNKDGYSRVDALVGGALLMEMTSWIMAIGSTWTRHFLYLKGCKRLYRLTVSLSRLVRALSWRRWSGNVGQFNIFDYARGHATKSIDIYSLKDLPPPMKITEHIKGLVLNEIMKIAARHGGEAQHVYSLNQAVEGRELPVLDCDFDTRIIIWHMLSLSGCKRASKMKTMVTGSSKMTTSSTKEAIGMLSDYMVFLLVKHPEMLVAHTSRQLCLEALDLVKFVDTRELAEYLRAESKPLTQRRLSRAAETGKNGPCERGTELAKSLVGNRWERRHLLEVMFGAWVVMLCYAGSHCSRDSHARRLSSGGELLTIVWQLAGHLSRARSAKKLGKQLVQKKWREEDRRHSLRMSMTGRRYSCRIQEDAGSQINQDGREGTSDAAPDT